MALPRLSLYIILLAFVLVVLLAAVIVALAAALAATQTAAATTLSAGLAIAGLLVLVIGYRLYTAIVRPLAAMGDLADKIAAGDLSHRINTYSNMKPITDLEKRFNRMLDALASRTIEAETARQQLQAVDDYRLNLLTEISTALREPIQAINTHSQMLELDAHGTLNEAQMRSVASIRRSIATEQSLLADLLEFAHTRKNGLHLTIERMWLPDLVEAVYQNAIKDRYADKDIQFVRDYDDYLPRIVGDPQRMEQIVERVLDWAFDLSAPESRVALSAVLRGDNVEIKITDLVGSVATPRSQKARLHVVTNTAYAHTHTPYRTHASLGMTFINTLIEQQGGTFTTDLRAGTCNTFTLTVPASQIRRKVA